MSFADVLLEGCNNALQQLWVFQHRSLEREEAALNGLPVVRQAYSGSLHRQADLLSNAGLASREG